MVCWSIGEYESVGDKTKDGTDIAVRVFTPIGKAEEGRFALEVAVKALEYYRNFFGVAYKLPKMDMLALADFAIGAMENWGLLTYRERLLLFDPEKTSMDTKQWVALIVAHEIAHQVG